MHPVLFSIGSLKVYSSYFFLLVAVLAGMFFPWREARKLGTSNREIARFWAAILPFALFIGLLNGFVFVFGLQGALKNLSSMFSTGLISFGVILGAFLLGWIYAVRKKLSVGPLLDLIALTFPLMLFFYRIGCLLNGCCYGLRTNSFLGMYLPGGDGEWAFRYPTQIMLMVFDLALFVGLWLYKTKKPFEGSLTLVFFLIYSSGRLFIDAFRDLPRVLGPLSLQQVTSLAILLVTLYVCFELWLRSRAKGKGD